MIPFLKLPISGEPVTIPAKAQTAGHETKGDARGAWAVHKPSIRSLLARLPIVPPARVEQPKMTAPEAFDMAGWVIFYVMMGLLALFIVSAVILIARTSLG